MGLGDGDKSKLSGREAVYGGFGARQANKYGLFHFLMFVCDRFML